MIEELEIRVATLDEIIDLRIELLIRGTVRVSARFDGDDADDTRHFGAFSPTANLACASCMNADLEGQPAWQLRGMATHEEYRSQGLGTRLLTFMETQLSDPDRPALLWCNARVGAVGFYQQAGWETVSDVFEIAGVGPHRKMVKTLAR